MRRVGAFLEDIGRIRKDAGVRTALGFIGTRVFERSETLLYELRPEGAEALPPESWRVVIVQSRDDAVGTELLRRAGGGPEFRNFRRGGVAFLLCIQDEPVAHGWYFMRNTLAKRLGSGAVYFGNFFVRPPWRGQGIQAWLTLHMVLGLPAGSRAIMEVVPSNVASQRGLAKAGCKLLGRLHQTVVLGQILRARIEAPKPPVRGGA